jgi:hypothetical protein
MLIKRQNSHAPRCKQRTGRRETQSREPVNRVKKRTSLCLYVHSMMAQCLTTLTIRLLATLEAVEVATMVEVVQDGEASPPTANGSGTC